MSSIKLEDTRYLVLGRSDRSGIELKGDWDLGVLSLVVRLSSSSSTNPEVTLYRVAGKSERSRNGLLCFFFGRRSLWFLLIPEGHNQDSTVS